MSTVLPKIYRSTWPTNRSLLVACLTGSERLTPRYKSNITNTRYAFDGIELD